MSHPFFWTRRRLLGGIAGSFATSVLPAAKTPVAGLKTISILHTTDLHGHIVPTEHYDGVGDVGGLARCATQIARWRAECPASLLFDLGDVYQGTPESLAKSFAACLRVVDHPKLAMAGDAVLVVSPDHCRVFLEAGWSKQRLHDELMRLLTVPADALLAGADGIAEGLPAALAGKQIPKFRPGGLLIVRAGGGAGLFSAIIAGWAASGSVGSIPVTQEITA